jgi:hypothetical protein
MFNPENTPQNPENNFQNPTRVQFRKPNFHCEYGLMTTFDGKSEGLGGNFNDALSRALKTGGYQKYVETCEDEGQKSKVLHLLENHSVKEYMPKTYKVLQLFGNWAESINETLSSTENFDILLKEHTDYENQNGGTVFDLDDRNLMIILKSWSFFDQVEDFMAKVFEIFDLKLHKIQDNEYKITLNNNSNDKYFILSIINQHPIIKLYLEEL